jgi:hypothetical protein
MMAGTTMQPSQCFRGIHWLVCFCTLALNIQSVAQPIIAIQPQNTVVASGCPATLTVLANGLPDVFYQWSKNGVAIPGADSPVLHFSSASQDDSGIYFVTAYNSSGIADSQEAVVWVSTNMRPIISTQPQSQTVPSGGTINLNVASTGTVPLGYQWLRNGVSLGSPSTNSYVKLNANESDSGLYSVLVTDCSGTRASAEALVIVNPTAASLSIQFFGLTNQLWRYEQSGFDLGSAWREPNYSDSVWPLGRGLFARQNNPAITPLTNTVLSLTNVGGSLNTYYFRTHFTLTNDPREVILVASNLFDDGGVVYLNGSEIYRINMPAGNITNGTLASSAPTENLLVTTTLPSDKLLPGDNVLAVEVHQVNAASSDVVFGLSLTTTFPPPTTLAITNQPKSLAIEEGKVASISVGVSGTPAWFQWYRNGVPLSGGTTNPLVLTSASTNDAGQYQVVVSNALHSLISSAALLTVWPDTNGPALVEADWGSSFTNVLVSFSERVSSATATNVANYKITNTLGGTLAVASAFVQPDGSNVLLRTGSARVPGNNYLLTVNRIRDISPRTNLIVTNSSLPVRSLISVLPLTASWRFYDPFPPFDEPDLGTAWKEFTYDEGFDFWSDGNGGFFNGQEAEDFPSPLGTFLAQTATVISYFRNAFNLPVSSGGLRLQFTHVIDDGGILYLNGREILRHNMPPGAATYLTPAASTVGIMTRVGPLTLPGAENFIRPGSNVLAFELHQSMEVDVDKGLGLQLDASIQSFAVGPVFITGGPWDLTVAEGAPTTFSVNQAGGTVFRWQQELSAIPGATNATLVIPAVPLSLHGIRFRVVVSNVVSGLNSSNATLRVLPDTNPPVLLSATGANNNTITLSFSEVLNAASATNLANYVVTNFSGSVPALLEAALVNGTNVVLTFVAPLLGQFAVIVNNVRDASAAQNLVAAHSSVGVAADYFVPMTSAWKYLLTGTNPPVHAAFMQPGYDDSAWSGPSNALLYQESGALPAPKNTEIAVSDGVFVRYPTFFFRQKFHVPIMGGSVVAQLRHVIDDGLVLHLNGQEIYRFNMPTGAISAGTLASSSVGDGELLGPYPLVITNLVAGTNVLAAEVHQATISNGDVCMGVELNIHVSPGPSGINQPPSQPPSAPPYLSLAKLSQYLILDWDQGVALDFFLEEAPAVTGPWTFVSDTSPHLTLRTNTAIFYRLRQ